MGAVRVRRARPADAAVLAEMANDLNVREQWQNVWPRIRDFRFDADARVRVSGDSAWIAAGWTTEATGPDGRTFARPGRGTFVLERRDGKWLAVHSHFSLLPSQSEAAHGRLPGRS